MRGSQRTYRQIPIEEEAANVGELLIRAARDHSESGVHTVTGERGQDVVFLSYPDLLVQARRILRGLQSRVGDVGARVVLLLEDPSEFIPAFWACLLGGYVPCALAPIRNDPNRWTRHLAHVDALLARPLFVSSSELLVELPAALATAAMESLREGPPHEPDLRAKPDDGAILMLTSGSTGDSKAVELTHGNLLASMRGRAERQQLTASDITLNWIAFDHVAALLESHMIALYVGANQFHASPAYVLTDPLRFLRLIHSHRITLAFAPNFLLGEINALLSKSGLSALGANMDLSCLKRIVTGGEANLVETGRRFLSLLAPCGLNGRALWPAFGMTETCAASVYSDEFPECDADREFAAVGRPITGLEIRIVDEDGSEVAKGVSGELQLRGAVIFRRYFNNDEATASVFAADGWFRSGDLGRIDDGGRLNLVARIKDSIIVSGVNYFSHELEKEVEQLDGVERSHVAVFPTRPKGADTEQLVVAYASTIPVSDEDRTYQLLVAIRDATVMLWGFRPSLILPLPRGAFPKTSLGKIQRSLMRKRFETGEYDLAVAGIQRIVSKHLGAYVPAEGKVEATVAGHFSEILRIELPALSVTTSFFDFGGTSVDILRLTQALERAFGIKAPVPFVIQNPTVRALATRITAASNGSEPALYDPLVPLQSSGRKLPLFCVHPGNGEIFVLVNVAKYFANDRPFFALRAAGFNEDEEYFKTLDEIVDGYIRAIVSRQPRGPYVIAGYSMGCEIAFELAKALERQGEEVAFLGLVDGPPRRDDAPLGFNMATGLALVLDLISLEQYERLNQELRPEPPSNEECEYILTFASPKRAAELDLNLRKFAIWSRVAHFTEKVLYGRVTSGGVKSATVFCSEGIASRYTRAAWTRQTWGAELRHWDRFASRTKYVDVPGTHHTLMNPRHVATFQALLRAEMDNAGI